MGGAAPDSESLFAALPQTEGGWPCIAADPPWRFKVWSRASGLGRSPDQHYDTLSLEQIATLPVHAVAANHAWLFFWTPGVHLKDALAIMETWGFRFSSVAFNWVKLRRSHEHNQLRLLPLAESDLHVGLGFTTRKNAEYCLLGRRGHPKRLSAGVSEVILAPVREHSRKPDEAHSRIERFCAGPRLELFARSHREGWTCWGDELDKFRPPETPPLAWLEAAE
jgi:N6-adenosine-specific RNA methylase IME4